MLSTAGFVILLIFGGGLLAAVWTFFVGFGGVPGAVLASKLASDENWHDGSGNWSLLALVVCVVGQSYVALAYGALVVSFTRDFLGQRPDLVGWIIWIVAWFISDLPASFGARDAARKPELKTQDVAITVTLAVSAIGFWVFVVFPAVMQAGWGWIPYVD